MKSVRKRESSGLNLAELPVDVLGVVVGFLDAGDDLLSVAQTCRGLRSVVRASVVGRPCAHPGFASRTLQCSAPMYQRLAKGVPTGGTDIARHLGPARLHGQYEGQVAWMLLRELSGACAFQRLDEDEFYDVLEETTLLLSEPLYMGHVPMFNVWNQSLHAVSVTLVGELACEDGWRNVLIGLATLALTSAKGLRVSATWLGGFAVLNPASARVVVPPLSTRVEARLAGVNGVPHAGRGPGVDFGDVIDIECVIVWGG